MLGLLVLLRELIKVIGIVFDFAIPNYNLKHQLGILVILLSFRGFLDFFLYYAHLSLNIDASLFIVIRIENIEDVLQDAKKTAFAIPLGISTVLAGCIILPRINGREAEDLTVQVRLVGGDVITPQIVVGGANVGEDGNGSLRRWRPGKEFLIVYEVVEAILRLWVNFRYFENKGIEGLAERTMVPVDTKILLLRLGSSLPRRRAGAIFIRIAARPSRANLTWLGFLP